MGNFLGHLIEDFVEPVAPILGGILGFAGGERSNEANIEMQREAQAWSAQEAWKNRAFQAHMSNTQVERRLTDLQKAGINPILAAGSAASSPGGAMGQAFMPQIKDTLTPAVNTALQGNKMIAETDNIRSQTKILAADLITAYLKSGHTDPKTGEVFVGQQGYETIKAKWEMDSAELDVEQQWQKLDILREELKILQRDGEIAASDAGVILRWIEKVISAISPFTGSAPQMLRGR